MDTNFLKGPPEELVSRGEGVTTNKGREEAGVAFGGGPDSDLRAFPGAAGTPGQTPSSHQASHVNGLQSPASGGQPVDQR